MLQSQIYFFNVATHIKSKGGLVVAYMPGNHVHMFVYKIDLEGVTKKTDLQTWTSTTVRKEIATEKW